MAVIDAEQGPVYIDEGAEVHPFTRIEGPCYVGPHSILLGGKCRRGKSIGPMCRVGGEIEGSIIHGYSNKYHDGFLGHAYVGQWVNLGALTTNSDLKNDYSNVSVVLDGRRPVGTGSTKVGSLVGDHAKTSIGTLLNTGAYVGAMTLIVSDGRLLPKFIPSFAWYLAGAVTEGFGKQRLYATARAAMSRRKCAWTEADESLWDAVYEMTAAERGAAIRKGRGQRRGGLGQDQPRRLCSPFSTFDALCGPPRPRSRDCDGPPRRQQLRLSRAGTTTDSGGLATPGPGSKRTSQRSNKPAW